MIRSTINLENDVQIEIKTKQLVDYHMVGEIQERGLIRVKHFLSSHSTRVAVSRSRVPVTCRGGEMEFVLLISSCNVSFSVGREIDPCCVLKGLKFSTHHLAR